MKQVPNSNNGSLGLVPVCIIDVWDWSQRYIPIRATTPAQEIIRNRPSQPNLDWISYNNWSLVRVDTRHFFRELCCKLTLDKTATRRLLMMSLEKRKA